MPVGEKTKKGKSENVKLYTMFRAPGFQAPRWIRDLVWARAGQWRRAF